MTEKPTIRSLSIAVAVVLMAGGWGERDDPNAVAQANVRIAEAAAEYGVANEKCDDLSATTRTFAART